MPPNDVKTLGSAQAGAFSPGWQYPIADPGAAVRNYMREQGILGNPFNQSWMSLVNSMAGRSIPQYLASLGPDTQNVEQGYGDYIGKMLSGEAPAWGMSQAREGLGKLTDMFGTAQQKMAGYGGQFDMSTPEGRQAAYEAGLSGGAFSPLEASIMGGYMDPQDQLRLFLGGYSGALGPQLTQGLGAAVRPMTQAWQDYGSTVSGGANFNTLLNVLMGSNAPSTGGGVPMQVPTGSVQQGTAASSGLDPTAPGMVNPPISSMLPEAFMQQGGTLQPQSFMQPGMNAAAVSQVGQRNSAQWDVFAQWLNSLLKGTVY